MPDLKGLGLKLGRHVSIGGLDPIPRNRARAGLKLPEVFHGVDLWNCYEASFLSPSGKPEVLHLQVHYDAHSPNMVESKSFKLYLNGFNNQTFQSIDHFTDQVKRDLSEIIGAEVGLSAFCHGQSPQPKPMRGLLLDDLSYTPPKPGTPLGDIVEAKASYGGDTFISHLLRTNCPVTDQPDWGTVIIGIEGEYQPVPETLLTYIVAYRNHQDFHESCCEAIFSDLHRILKPMRLIVRCHYTRRGGLDINPVRATAPVDLPSTPMWRQ